MRDRAAFLEFLREADDIMSSLKGGRYNGLDHLKRLVHTLKGNSAIFGMRCVSGICHELENKIAEQGEAPTRIEMAVLDQAWDRIRSDIQKLVGGTHQSRIEIDDHDYEVVLKALHDGIDVNTVGRMIESWRLEPTEKRLLTIEQQIRGIAERIGKTNLSVFVEPNDLRFNSERFAPFWSAFIHVLRNAVDHGIEDREERQKAGKPAQSVIRVATSMDHDRFVITVEDDGPGVDWERLRTKAAELGVPASALKEPLDLICLPRLSSKDTITELSGRGIGLGIVVDACKALGGTVEVQSQQGIGTRIEFAFPKSPGIYEGHMAVLEAASILVAR
jgi:two-component system chemotaxis sensor kinase CheA